MSITYIKEIKSPGWKKPLTSTEFKVIPDWEYPTPTELNCIESESPGRETLLVPLVFLEVSC